MDEKELGKIILSDLKTHDEAIVCKSVLLDVLLRASKCFFCKSLESAVKRFSLNNRLVVEYDAYADSCIFKNHEQF